MLVRRLLVTALAVFIFSQHSTVSLTADRTPGITSTRSKARNNTGSSVNSNRPVHIVKILEGQDVVTVKTENATKSDINNQLEIIRQSPNITDDVTKRFVVPGNKWKHAVSADHASIPHSLDLDDSRQGAPDTSAAESTTTADNGRLQTSLRAPHTNVPQTPVVVVVPRTQSLNMAMTEVPARILPLMQTYDPEPPEWIADCSYDESTPPVTMATTPVHDAAGCASCELDDDGAPLNDFTNDGAVQLLPDGVDIKTAGGRVQHPLRDDLLDRDTFSAEDRHRRPFRVSDQPSINCTCSVGDYETTCSSGGVGRYCDRLPHTDAPSGILDVSHTNISVLSAGSLSFVANVSVLRLAWNEVACVEQGVFANMTMLTNLSLAHNRLSELNRGALKGASKLREVVLAYNMFTNLTHATRALNVDVTPELAHLNIGGNNFTAIGPEDFAPMSGVPLQDLQLHENTIRDIDPRTFVELKHLRRLRLRNNELSIQTVVDLVEEMHDSSLQLIDLSMIGKYTITQLRPILVAVANSSISTLQLNNYCFSSLYGRYFPKFTKLKALTMRNCGIKYICPNTFSAFIVLESLDLRDNYFTYPPSAVILPTLVSLDLSRPALLASGETKPAFAISQYRFRNMVNLKYLDLSHNNITKLERGAFVGLENLTVLLLKNNELEHIANFSFSMMENLSELYLSNNYLGSQAFEHLWQGLTGLTVLFLDYCQVNTSNLYLSEMPRTELLNLTGNSLRNLTSNTFRGLSSLNTVDLSHNHVLPWEERVFADARDVERIYLRYNNITWIASAMAEDFLDLLNLRVLMLGYNPFYCSCHLHDWLDGQFGTPAPDSAGAHWRPFQDIDDGYITNDIDDCHCDSPKNFSNMSVQQFYNTSFSPCVDQLDPAEMARILFTMLPVFVSGMVVVLAIRFVYKKRWYLRYWLFKLTSKRWLKKLRKDSEGYLYDAFVSYSSEDANFVMEMIDQLEKTPPFYRLCVYERDFEIGNVISECILESINTSRKSILILTDHFAKSHWCRWEMNLVQCRLFEQTRDDLILVKLGKIRSRHLTPTIRYLMRTRIYIERGPSPQQQLLFWERLRSALRRPGGSPELPRTV